MGQKDHILLIEKDGRLRDAAACMLTAAGFSVHSATTLRESLTGITSEPIGLLLCGLELEDISTVDLLKYLKNDPLREAIFFFFFLHSKNRALLSPDRSRELGADAVIYYPAEADGIIDQIRGRLPDSVGNEKKTPAGSTVFPESFLQPRKESALLKRKETASLRNAKISLNGKEWAPCQILNHTFHGVMVETKLRGKQGSSVLLRYAMPAGPMTARGRLIHVLLGDHERPMGMGINFNGDAAWRQIHMFIKSEGGPVSAVEKASPAAAPPSMPAPVQARSSAIPEISPAGERIRPPEPIGIEVSRTGDLWMYGEIIEYEKSLIAITTPILGKSGEALHIRFTLPGEQIVLKGRIEKVTLNNFKMPAGMEISFSEEERWDGIRGEFAVNEKARKQPESIQTPTTAAKPGSEQHTRKPEPGKQNWTDTLVESKHAPLPESIKDRFYKSLIGKKLGNYEIVSFLNAGSMGGVFKGWDIALERDVAIKVISYELSSQEEFVEMFFKEARLVSKLNHPNIAHIYFIGNETGIVYYAMEFIHGKTLAELMGGSRCIEAKKAVGYLVDSCKALDRVWRENIIHRDIKPANIMISEHGIVKLLDFGVAQKQKKGVSSPRNRIVGSPPYLSPETIREQPVDSRSDIYSLGATFYHVLQGSPPFIDDTLEGLLGKHLNEHPTPLREILHDLSPTVSDTIQKMLAKDPENRFQSYQEIIDALAAAV